MRWVTILGTFATCRIALTTYKYSELQVSNATQKLSCKANCKTPFFFVVNGAYFLFKIALVFLFELVNQKMFKMEFSKNGPPHISCHIPFESELNF
jgi:hypothetical protein